MANIGTRSSVCALVVETTEGTAVAPTAATQYTALQGDLSITPSFDVLQSDEKRSSIGKAKNILGAERPTVSFSHYLRHSGTEGTAPDYNDTLKAIFGTETVNGTERATDGASSTTVLNVTAGVGSDFVRGSAMLIKDTTNGYRIRAVHSRSTDAITLGFQVASAPATATSLGKCVYYSPANADHQVTTLWHYIGNGGAVEMISGVRWTEASIEASAGELINMQLTGAGIGYYKNPVEITAATSYIDFEDDGGNKSVQLTLGFYKDPHELAAAAALLMDTISTTTTSITCTYSDTTGKYTFTAAGDAVFKLEWSTGANTANTAATKFGFAVADETGALTYTSDTAMSFASPYTPTLDSADPVAAKYNEVMFGDQDDYACFAASQLSVSIANERSELKSICAQSGISGSIITGREVKISLTALLNKYDVDAWRRYRSNTESRFQFSFGEKVGANWVAGKCGYIYAPTCTVTDFKITEADSLAVLEMELTCFVDSSGNGEIYAGFL